MVKAVPFAALQNLLEQHGYVLFSVRGSHRIFRHADNDKPVIVLPVHNSRVTAAHMRAVRRVLDETAVVPAEEFDAAIRKKAS